MNEDLLPEDVRVALDAYRREKNNASWTALSQMSVRDVDVLDALKLVEPEFPDPLPLPVDGLLEDSADFFQWQELPEPDTVLRAILAVLNKRPA